MVEFPYIPHPVCLIMNILYSYGTFITISESVLITKVRTSFRFSQFFTNVLFLFQDLIIFCCHVSLDSSWLWYFLGLPLILMILTFLRGIMVRYFVAWIGICLSFFCWLGWGLGRKTTEIKYHSHHIISRVHTINMM